MVFPLVREMAATGAHIRVPVAVACRVDQELGISVGEKCLTDWDRLMLGTVSADA
jgi:hypothetical protein